MNFTDLIFIFLFLPCSLLIYYTVRKELKDYALLGISLVFYAFGSFHYFIRFLECTCVTVATGRVMYALRRHRPLALILLILGVAFNMAVLSHYKYGLRYGILGQSSLMPLGISFFTFKAVSYLADIYKGKIELSGLPVKEALYLSFFSQIQSGPLSRYDDTSKNLCVCGGGYNHLSNGFCRFTIGFNKKILLANVLTNITDEVFASTPSNSSPSYLWLGAICYSLQIYYDFSGYSDMAIGISNMFGYECPENFIYPYTTTSVSKFWRKWHITLGAWFRDYVYIPLGGSRCNARWRVYANLLVVWLLTGIWHGATFNFIFWGLGYFVIIALEKMTGFPEKLKSNILKALYRMLTLLFINFQWIIFRSDDLRKGLSHIKHMFLPGTNSLGNARTLFLLQDYLPFIIGGIAFCVPIVPFIQRRIAGKPMIRLCFTGITCITSLLLFIWSISFVIAGRNNPFAYANF